MSKPSQPSVSPVSRRTLFAGAGTAGALAAAATMNIKEPAASD